MSCLHPNHPEACRYPLADEPPDAPPIGCEFDDDGDDDEIPADPENFDGGFGNGSYFQRAMRKED